MSKVTIKDVAKHSGYSVATVSAVINEIPVVSEKSKIKILQTIKDLSYRPNYIARSLKNSKTLSLGIIVRDITNPFYPEVVSGIEEIAWSNNYDVFLCNTENDIKREESYIENLISKQVDGIFITTAINKRSQAYERLRELNIPYIYINRKPELLHEDEYFVGSDNQAAVNLVIQYLKEIGITSIAFLAGPQYFFNFNQRLSTFRHTMKSEDIEINEDWIFINDEFNEEIGYNNIKEIIKSGKLPECIFCSGDLMAFGAYRALEEEGIKIPEQVSLISIDNNRFANLIGLSSVDMNNKEMGRMAGEIMLEVLEDKNEAIIPERQIFLNPRLIIRSSCKKSKNNI
jgi:DNA-binding LacI/PurR family transcriptional regulator